MNYGTFEMHPAVWNDRETWVRYGASGTDSDWRNIDFAQVMTGARPMTKDEFEQAFPALPPMPKAAFHASLKDLSERQRNLVVEVMANHPALTVEEVLMAFGM